VDKNRCLLIAYLLGIKIILAAGLSYPVATKASQHMTDSQSSPFVHNARRSQRVAARIRVTVTRRGGEVSTLSEDTYTLVVSAHGGLIVLAMDIKPGEILALRNVLSLEEQIVRVVRVSEKEESGSPVAIEFTNPAPHFWQIDFPPADWTPTPDSIR